MRRCLPLGWESSGDELSRGSRGCLRMREEGRGGSRAPLEDWGLIAVALPCNSRDHSVVWTGKKEATFRVSQGVPCVEIVATDWTQVQTTWIAETQQAMADWKEMQVQHSR